MKKTITLLLIITLLILSLSACASNSELREIDKMISNLGEITLDSKEEIEAIQKKIEGLEKDEINELEHHGQFKRAVHNLEVLSKEEEQKQAVQKAVDDVETLITAIGTVTHESDNAIRKARSAYEELPEESRQLVSSYAVLERAEQELTIKNAEHVTGLLDNMGEITADSEKTIRDIEKQYKGLSDEERKLVTNSQLLDKAWEEYYKIYAQSLIRVTDVSVSSPDSAGGVELYFNFVNNSEKTIKYVYFGVTFYNRVNDIVCCKYKDDVVNQCQLTGPYEQGQGLTGTYWHWGDYYSWDIDRVELVNLSVEYMDGSRITFSDKMMPYVQY